MGKCNLPSPHTPLFISSPLFRKLSGAFAQNKVPPRALTFSVYQILLPLIFYIPRFSIGKLNVWFQATEGYSLIFFKLLPPKDPPLTRHMYIRRREPETLEVQQMRSQKMEELERKVSRHLIFSVLHLFTLSKIIGDLRGAADALSEDGRVREKG